MNTNLIFNQMNWVVNMWSVFFWGRGAVPSCLGGGVVCACDWQTFRWNEFTWRFQSAYFRSCPAIQLQLREGVPNPSTYSPPLPQPTNSLTIPTVVTDTILLTSCLPGYLGIFFQHHREQTEGARLLEPPFQYHPTRLVGHCRGKGPSRVFGVGSTMSFISWDWSSAFRFSSFQRCWQTNKWSCCSEEDKDRSSSGWRRLSYHCNSWDSSSRRNVFIWEFLQSFVDDSGYFQNH